MGKKKKLNPFQYKELMQAEKIAAPMIEQVKAELRKKCLQDQLNLEALMIGQGFCLYFWILHDKFEWGNKRLSALLDACMDNLSGLSRRIEESDLDYVGYITKWFESIEEEIKIKVRELKEEEDLGLVFGGEAKYANIAEEIQWKKTEWAEVNTVSDEELEKLRSNVRLVNRAKTILEQYRLDVRHKLLRMYAQDSSRDSRSIQNIVLATICVELHDKFGFGHARLVKIIHYMDDLAKCFSSRFDGRDSGYSISIEDIMNQLEEETKISFPGLEAKSPFKIGQYIIDLSEEGKVVWEKKE